jgi:transcriptional regulator with XRE-family HTH domain
MGKIKKKMKISRNAVDLYETGEQEPHFETLEVIADYFNVDISVVIFGVMVEIRRKVCVILSRHKKI